MKTSKKKTRKVKRSAFMSAFCATTSRVVMTKKSALHCFFFFYRTLVFKKKGVKNRSFTKKEKRYYHP